MAPVNDDLDIRAALADLTEDQPPFPPGRLSAVRRRARQHRRRVAATTVAAVAAVAVAVSLATLPRAAGPQQLTARHVPGWALPWPDHRNGSVPQSVLDRAVLAWLYQGPMGMPDAGHGNFPGRGASARRVAQLANTYPVVWYVGQTIDHGAEVVVTFEADGPSGPQLVVGYAQASQVMSDQPAWSGASSPWALTATAAPSRHRPPLAIGQYVIPAAGPMGANWVVLLTAPDVREVTWLAATTDGVRRPTVRTVGGLVVAYAGRLTSQVELTGLSTSHGLVPLRNIPIGIPGARGATNPGLTPPPAPTVPASLSYIQGWGGQGPEQDEDASFAPGHGRYAFIAVCYGPKPLRLTVDGHHVGTVSCDDRQQQIAVPHSALRKHTIMFRFETSNLTAYQIDFGSVRRH
jgi:hypothetical protein